MSSFNLPSMPQLPNLEFSTLTRSQVSIHLLNKLVLQLHRALTWEDISASLLLCLSWILVCLYIREMFMFLPHAMMLGLMAGIKYCKDNADVRSRVVEVVQEILLPEFPGLMTTVNDAQSLVTYSTTRTLRLRHWLAVQVSKMDWSNYEETLRIYMIVAATYPAWLLINHIVPGNYIIMSIGLTILCWKSPITELILDILEKEVPRGLKMMEGNMNRWADFARDQKKRMLNRWNRSVEIVRSSRRKVVDFVDSAVSSESEMSDYSDSHPTNFRSSMYSIKKRRGTKWSQKGGNKVIQKRYKVDEVVSKIELSTFEFQRYRFAIGWSPLVNTGEYAWCDETSQGMLTKETIENIIPMHDEEKMEHSRGGSDLFLNLKQLHDESATIGGTDSFKKLVTDNATLVGLDLEKSGNKFKWVFESEWDIERPAVDECKTQENGYLSNLWDRVSMRDVEGSVDHRDEDGWEYACDTDRSERDWGKSGYRSSVRRRKWKRVAKLIVVE